jgi:aconitase B
MQILGKLPSVAEYQKYAAKIQTTAADTFRYLNFDRLPEFVSKGSNAKLGADYESSLQKELEKLKQRK